MAWRASHYVAAGALATGMLVWAAHQAWPSREIPVALPLVVTSAYDEWRDTLSRNEMLSDVLARAGITGHEYVAFMNAAHTLNPRRMQPGMVFELRRLKGASVANRLGVRLDPEKRLWMVRQDGDSGWKEVVEEIPWNTERLRTTAVIQTNLYDALDAAIPDSFLPVRQRVGLAWAIADVYDWEVDFTRDLRPGDRVEVLIERLQSPEGERRLGRVLAARVDVGGQAELRVRISERLLRRARSLAAARVPARAAAVSSHLEPVRRPLPPDSQEVALASGNRLCRRVRDAGSRHRGRCRDAGGAQRRIRKPHRAAPCQRRSHALRASVEVRERAARGTAHRSGADDRLRGLDRVVDGSPSALRVSREWPADQSSAQGFRRGGARGKSAAGRVRQSPRAAAGSSSSRAACLPRRRRFGSAAARDD
jgi:hypothetical protein